MPNPFQSSSQLNGALSRDLCQQIHYNALNAVALGKCREDLPERLSIEILQQTMRSLGRNALIAHPGDLEVLYQGLTLAVYQTIATLYCSRLQRSIPMVWRILSAYAARVGVAPISYEAVWSICVYLSERRCDSIKVTIQYVSERWDIFLIRPNVRIQAGENTSTSSVIACVADAQKRKFLAFRVAHPDQVAAATTLALYDALIYRRQPAQDGAAGVQWFIPEQIVAQETIAGSLRQACMSLKINLNEVCGEAPMLEALSDGWERDLRDRVLSKRRLAATFDNYLVKVHGYGPVRAYQQCNRDYDHLKGYGQDPAAIFPALRTLLPIHQGLIKQGVVVFDDLHYEDDLLSFWDGHAVELRRSEASEAIAWVYLNGNILCQAMARELRRQDGSYRSKRVMR